MNERTPVALPAGPARALLRTAVRDCLLRMRGRITKAEGADRIAVSILEGLAERGVQLTCSETRVREETSRARRDLAPTRRVKRFKIHRPDGSAQDFEAADPYQATDPYEAADPHEEPGASEAFEASEEPDTHVTGPAQAHAEDAHEAGADEAGADEAGADEANADDHVEASAAGGIDPSELEERIVRVVRQLVGDGTLFPPSGDPIGSHQGIERFREQLARTVHSVMREAPPHFAVTGKSIREPIREPIRESGPAGGRDE